MTAKNTLCLWYDKHALEAATFYASIFPDSEVKAVRRAPRDYPSGHQGDVLTVEFTVLGIPCLGSTAVPPSRTAKPSRSRWPPTTRKKPTACGTLSSATAAAKASAAGAKTSGA